MCSRQAETSRRKGEGISKGTNGQGPNASLDQDQPGIHYVAAGEAMAAYAM